MDYKILADNQTKQLDSLSRSIAAMNLINKKTSQEWSKTIKRMKQARDEVESMVTLMMKIKDENTKLKQEVQILKQISGINWKLCPVCPANKD